MEVENERSGINLRIYLHVSRVTGTTVKMNFLLDLQVKFPCLDSNESEAFLPSLIIHPRLSCACSFDILLRAFELMYDLCHPSLSPKRIPISLSRRFLRLG